MRPAGVVFAPCWRQDERPRRKSGADASPNPYHLDPPQGGEAQPARALARARKIITAVRMMSARIAPSLFFRKIAIFLLRKSQICETINHQTGREQMFYATQDSEGLRIHENADIRAFETEAEARAYILSVYDKSDWKHETAKFEAGRFGDCWVSTTREPDLDRLTPFKPDDLIVRAPGSHPGGKQYWIEPSEPVLVLSYMEQNEE